MTIAEESTTLPLFSDLYRSGQTREVCLEQIWKRSGLVKLAFYPVVPFHSEAFLGRCGSLIMTPKDSRCSSPESVTVTLCKKRVFGDAIKLRILRGEIILDYPVWPQMAVTTILMKDRRDFTHTHTQKAGGNEGRGWSQHGHKQRQA